MRELPSGTVTFLFTDVEGSTRLLHELGPARYADALGGHRRVLREAFSRHGGIEVDTQGDAFFVAFSTAPGAVAAAVEAQAALSAGPIRVRMGLHTGTPLLTEEGYVGPDVHRAARIAAVAHGGQVLLSRATHELLDAHVPIRDLADHRLKDLSAPERLYQLGDVEFPPLASLHRTNLPIPSTPFVGRDNELAEVVELLAREDVRLLTLTGAGGTGKTRLGAQAAGMASSRYADGVWWVPLSAVREHELVLETAKQALGARTDLGEHIGDRSMLLLFDNFEQVVEAAVGVASLVAACTNLNVLVTSREPLRVGGEHQYPVPTLLHDEAIALFVARATAVERSFETGSAVSEICGRLDNLPLAIELAAARVKALSSAQILDRLERRLPLLTGGARDVPERQRTLRATIEWSYELLTGAEQRLFRRLAAFFGGCTLEAAVEVADADVDTLQSLVDKSLLRYGADRYWMLETIREFAHEELTRARERDSMTARHAGYFVAVAERAEPFFETNDESTWLDRLARDHDNFRGALASSRNSPQQLRLACALWRFWLRRGLHREGRRWLEGGLMARGEAAPADVTLALRATAVFARIQGDFDTAERLATESITVAKQTRDRTAAMQGLGALANIALVRREYTRASKLMAEVEALAHELGNDQAVLVTLGNRAYLAIQLADFDRAFALAEEARALGRKMGDPATTVTAALNLGLAAHALGKQREARDALVDGIELARSSGHRPFLVNGLVVAAAVVVANDPSTAAHLLAATSRAQVDLGIELDPAEQDLLDSVGLQLHQRRGDTDTDQAVTGDLDLVLDTAAGRALQSLKALEIIVPS